MGHPPDARLLILNCNDLGMCHSANEGVYDSLRDGLATSASIMVPCPWGREAAARYRGEDIGVHLTLTAEFEHYRWGPCTQAPSLLGGDGGFPRTVDDAWEHADLDETRRELRAQVERAILWGFDVTHLDSHMGAAQLRPEFFDIMLDLAVEFSLPMQLPSPSDEVAVGFPMRELAGEEGVLTTDHLVLTAGVGGRRTVERAVMDLQPGVTEICLHPATDHSELRSLAPNWAERVDDHHLLTRDSELRAMVSRSGAVLVGWRDVREAQRRG